MHVCVWGGVRARARCTVELNCAMISVSLHLFICLCVCLSITLLETSLLQQLFNTRISGSITGD